MNEERRKVRENETHEEGRRLVAEALRAAVHVLQVGSAGRPLPQRVLLKELAVQVSTAYAMAYAPEKGSNGYQAAQHRCGHISDMLMYVGQEAKARIKEYHTGERE